MCYLTLKFIYAFRLFCEIWLQLKLIVVSIISNGAKELLKIRATFCQFWFMQHPSEPKLYSDQIQLPSKTVWRQEGRANQNRQIEYFCVATFFFLPFKRIQNASVALFFTKSCPKGFLEPPRGSFTYSQKCVLFAQANADAQVCNSKNFWGRADRTSKQTEHFFLPEEPWSSG